MSNKKNILTVAPFLADDFVEISEIVFDVDQYKQFIRDNKHRLGLFGKYLICKFHDSRIIETNVTDKVFSITLNDFSTYVFADAIIERNNLSIDSDNISFPIQLDFKTISKVSFNEVDDEGNLTEIEPGKLDEYLYEQIISIDNDKIELAFTFWKTFPDDKPGQRFILLLTATDIIITEQQDIAWQQTFGSDFDDYYKYFKQQFDSDRYVSDHHKCLELIDEYDSKKSSTNA
jgi:hypothetical protein